MNVRLAVGTLILAAMIFPGIARGQNNPDDSLQSITGCLSKGAAANSYAFLDENGKLWEVHSKTVQLGPHVGHTVTLVGTVPPKPKDDGSSADKAPENHLVVTELKMISDTCQQRGK